MIPLLGPCSMTAAAEDSISLRFRHTLGDIGPFQVEPSSSIQSVKEELFSRWPTGACRACCSTCPTTAAVQRGRFGMMEPACTSQPHLTGHRVDQPACSQPAEGHPHTRHTPVVSVLPLHAEGPLSKESPTSSADLRLLCSGQFLDNAKTLKGAVTS